MKLEQWVIFIDMLGYRKINGEITDDEQAKDFISFMKSNEEMFGSQTTEDKKEMYKKGAFDLYRFYDIQLAFVSDSLIINYKPKEFSDPSIDERIRVLHSANTLIIILNRLQTFIYNCLKEKEILIRGGISNKYCYVDQNFAVGEGLIDAYVHESQIARYPRIVISEQILKIDGFIKSFNLIVNSIYGDDTFFNTDESGVTFLDYLKFNISIMLNGMAGNMQALLNINSFLRVHKEVIEKKLLNTDNAIKEAEENKTIKSLNEIRKKIIWLRDYHNRSVEQLGPQYLIK